MEFKEKQEPPIEKKVVKKSEKLTEE